MRICYAGIKFFFQNVLKREWHLLTLAKAPRERRLPAVLSREEVKKLLTQVKGFHNYAYLLTVYTCGLRLQEGLFLEVTDIDGPRKMIHIHRGKAPRIAMFRYPRRPMPCFAATGPPIATKDSSSRRLAGAGLRGQPPNSPCPLKGCRAPCAGRRLRPPLTRRTFPSTYPAPFLCHPPLGGRGQSPSHSEISRPFQHRDHHDLSPSD